MALRANEAPVSRWHHRQLILLGDSIHVEQIRLTGNSEPLSVTPSRSATDGNRSPLGEEPWFGLVWWRKLLHSSLRTVDRSDKAISNL